MGKVSEIKVKKRNGLFEKYDPRKIKRVVEASGLEENEARKLVLKVTQSLKASGISEITSLE